jgi:hypothetical protein
MRLSWITSIIYALEFRHIGIRGSLTVNGPGGAMIVRRGDARLFIDMSQYLEAKLRIVMQQMQSCGSAVRAMRGNEIGILDKTLEKLPNPLTSLRSRVGLQGSSAILHELGQVI